MKKKLFISIIVLLAILIAIPAIYVVYLQLQYHRIPDHTELEIKNSSEKVVEYGKTYTAMTYNIGFGAYSQDYSFFMDESVQKDTKKVIKGRYGKGISRDSVLSNTQNSIKIAKEYDCDFYLLQEVDTDSDRSYKINQAQMFGDLLSEHESAFASNFHSGFLALPLHDMHGIVNGGILTLSKYHAQSSIRRSFPVSDNFVSKFFDLDRCFTIHRFNLDDKKELVLLNIHMSAYDEGGMIRKAQLEMLNTVLKDEYEKGNYVVAGGDFNHDYCESRFDFPGDKETPAWLAIISDEDLAKGYRFIVPENKKEAGTCRGSESPYDPATTAQFIVDGFIVSDNVDASAKIVDAQYLASDHNPVILTFKFKK